MKYRYPALWAKLISKFINRKSEDPADTAITHNTIAKLSKHIFRADGLAIYQNSEAIHSCDFDLLPSLKLPSSMNLRDRQQPLEGPP